MHHPRMKPPHPPPLLLIGIDWFFLTSSGREGYFGITSDSIHVGKLACSFHTGCGPVVARTCSSNATVIVD